ncbi:hypothetical protein CAS74_000451 [Pichia kudriavzevii]|uniref:Protein FYV10 n=1 Tax=Pichia kudriavzevii TaxID=4909 RepID=A0A099NVR4_PICKU|nr:hypothetical protein JL09_g4141 [Pichia kudriavzevii]ONH75585.1 Protein FYV10 [Pichia kudriavzevii]OUT24068.1 hypothetical protein CAS74_000451 [Pichia kudriavzevii]
MQAIKDPDHYLNINRQQFKTPLEVLRKNFRNVQKRIEKNKRDLVELQHEFQTASEDNRLEIVDRMIRIQRDFNDKIKHRIEHHNEYVDKMVVRIQYFDKIKELSRKYLNIKLANMNDMPEDLQEFYRHEINVMIVDYLLKNLDIEDFKDVDTHPGVKVARTLKLNDFIDSTIILQGLKIAHEIKDKHNLKLLKKWCIENKKNLKTIKELKSSKLGDIEFECDFQLFIDHIINKRFSQGLIFARNNLQLNVKKLSIGSTVIWAQSLIEHINSIHAPKPSNPLDYYTKSREPENTELVLAEYLKYLKNDRWIHLSNLFLLNFKFIYGMNERSNLETMLILGASVLKTKSCKKLKTSGTFGDFKIPRLSSGLFIQANDCPICSIELNEICDSVPCSIQSKSNIYDDAVLLPNNNVYSFKKLMFYNREDTSIQFHEFQPGGFPSLDDGRKVLDPLTGETFNAYQLKKVFPL